MLKRNKSKPVWDLFPKKQTHKVRNGTIVVGAVAAGSAALAALLNRKGAKS